MSQTKYFLGHTTSHKCNIRPIRDRNSSSGATSRSDGHSLIVSRSRSSLATGTEMVMATVSISHPTTHNTVSHDENYLGGSSAGSPEELCPKSWKWSDASGADACRQRQPSDHHRITTNITSSTCYRTKKKLRTLIFVTTTVLLVHILRSMCAVLARIYLYTHSTMRTFTYSSEASF